MKIFVRWRPPLKLPTDHPCAMEPIRPLSRTPMSPFQTDGTAERYARHLTVAVCLVVRTRSASTYELPLPPDVEKLAEDVRESLREDGYSDAQVVRRVHALVRAIVLREWQPEEGNAIPDPIMRSAILSMLQPDGRFKSVQSLTPALAGLKYFVVRAFPHGFPNARADAGSNPRNRGSSYSSRFTTCAALVACGTSERRRTRTGTIGTARMAGRETWTRFLASYRSTTWKAFRPSSMRCRRRSIWRLGYRKR